MRMHGTPTTHVPARKHVRAHGPGRVVYANDDDEGHGARRLQVRGGQKKRVGNPAVGKPCLLRGGEIIVNSRLTSKFACLVMRIDDCDAQKRHS